MARREWAEQTVEKARLHYNDGEPSPFISVDQARQLLRKEHARAVRIVKREIRRGTVLGSLDNVLAALQKGRA